MIWAYDANLARVLSYACAQSGHNSHVLAVHRQGIASVLSGKAWKAWAPTSVLRVGGEPVRKKRKQ